MESAKKRIRTENWLEEDRLLLLDLVKERVKILEDKCTSTNINKKKKEAWTDLQQSFNSLCKGVHRTIPQLKSAWGQVKLSAKRVKSEERKNIFKTGGGPPPSPPPSTSAVGNDIEEWLPNEFTIDTNEFDSDALPSATAKASESDPLDLKNASQVFVPDAAADDTGNDENYENLDAPADLIQCPVKAVQNPDKDPKPKKIKKIIKKTPRRAVHQSNVDEIVNTEKKCRLELHELQMQNMKQLHEIQMEIHKQELIAVKMKIENETKKGRNLDMDYGLLK